MTTYGFTIAPDNTSDATFRNWVQTIITAVTTVGLVQTADTGQINTTTVAKPATVNGGIAGYAMFRFADTAQASWPLFIKLEFGTMGGSAPGIPMIWLTIGRGTDGAGNIVGTLFAKTPLGAAYSSTSGTATVFTGWASGGDGWVVVIPEWDAATVIPLPYFGIERLADGAGVAVLSPPVTTNGGGDSGPTSTTAPLVHLTVVNHATAAYAVGVPPVVLPYKVNGTTLSAGSSLAAGSIGPVFPWVVIAPGLAPTQLAHMMSYAGGDVPGGIFTTSLAGQSHTFRPITCAGCRAAFGVSLNPDSLGQFSHYLGLAIAWE